MAELFTKADRATWREYIEGDEDANLDSLGVGDLLSLLDEVDRWERRAVWLARRHSCCAEVSDEQIQFDIDQNPDYYPEITT